MGNRFNGKKPGVTDRVFFDRIFFRLNREIPELFNRNGSEIFRLNRGKRMDAHRNRKTGCPSLQIATTSCMK